MLPVSFVVALAVASPVPVQAPGQPPATVSAIPVFPGAERYDPGLPPFASAPIRERLLGLPDGWPLATTSANVYAAAVAAEQVAAYYRSVIRATPSSFDAWNAIDPRLLTPGQSTAIHYQPYQAAGTTQHLYHWYRREQNGDVVVFELLFSSSSDLRSSARPGPFTEIHIGAKTYSKGIIVTSPGEKALGAPVYPGAVYDSNDSRTVGGGLITHCFLTSDPVDRVVAFYETRLEKKAMKGDPPAGGVTWAFLGYAAAGPDNRLIVQEERGKGPAYKTRIDFTLVKLE